MIGYFYFPRFYLPIRSLAIKEGVIKANPVLLEPMMKVEVEVPEDFLGDAIGDLNSRRGQIEGMEVAETDFDANRCLVIHIDEKHLGLIEVVR